MEPVLVDRRDTVAIVTLNRPERRNALNSPLKDALREVLPQVAADESVRAVVLTGAGGHFCVGQDLAEHAELLADSPERALATVADQYGPVVRAIVGMPKPVIAAVEGGCVGAGLGLALACDLRVYSADARLGTAFTGIGLTCDSGLSHTLSRAVGEAKARELVLLGDPFTAEQAVAWGIAGSVVPAGEVLDAATALATRLAGGPTTAYAESKLLLADTWTRTLDATLDAEADAQLRLGATADHGNAVRAFLAKQKPTFTGR